MTKKFKSTTPLMELDLDSFLHHHSDDDGDDQIHSSIPHRTVDDILNDSDSSSSSSPPSLKSDTVSVRSSLAAEITVTRSNSVEKRGNSDDKSGSYKYNLIQRLKSDEFSSSRRTGSSRPSSSLSSLFGGVRSSAKPGAALAAAAAVSRSVPTPHAAAIKSRRAGSLNNEMLGVVKDEVFDRVSVIGSGRTEGKSEGEDGDQLGEFQSALVEKSGSENGELESERGVVEISKGGVDAEKEEAQEGKLPNEEDIKKLSDQEASGSSFVAESERGSSLNNEDEFSLDKKIVMSKDYVDDNHSIAPRGADWDIVDHVGSTAPNTEVVRGSSSECKKDERVHQDSNVGTSGTQNTEKAPIGSENEAAEIIKDDLSSISDDVTELVQDRIAQLESQRIRREAEKKLRPAKKPLELAEELETKQASTGLHWEEGAAAQPMRLEGVRRGSTVLGYFDIDADNTLSRAIKSQSFRHDYGSPHVLALHPSYIAVGMSKGIVIVVPSKYSPYHPDNLDAKMLMLGAQGDRSQVPVTSICFNQQGDLLLAGYGDGHITVWDVPKASVAKVITGEHSVPVVHAFFLGQDPQVTRQFKAITGDSKGLVLLHEFSVMPLLGRFTIKTQCLLDGQRTGTVLCASPLLPDELGGAASVASQGNMTGAAGSIGGMMGGVVAGGAGWRLFNEGATLSEEGVVIFVTHQTALVVRFSPSLEVYAQLPKPEGVREGSMPYTAWKCTTQSQNSSAETTNVEALEKISLLAIAWDRKVQVAKLVKSELKVCGKWTLESVAIGLAWLDDQMLVVITLSGQLCLYSRDGTLIHQTSYVIDGCAGDDMIAYQTHFTNVFGNPEKSYHNSLSVRGASIYILGPVHVVVSRLLPWKERVQVLRKAGDWMGALNMAMTLYDGQAHGVFDLPRSLDAVQEAIMPYLVDLLFSYVDEVFSYISVACFNQIGKMEQSDGSKSTSSSVHSEIKEQFARVGGVAVEFCVHIKRTDILFDEIFSKFVKVQQRDTFLELLEPYILKDMLGSLPPEIMQALVEHYNSKGWLQRVEQCILHMDISSLDFNQVVRLCRENGLYGALIYLFNKGLDDFRTPLEELLVVLRDSERDSATSLGYRMLVYLKYCFSGLAFPPGHGTLPSERLFSLRTELVQFLLEDSGACKSQTVTHLISMGAYLNLYFLLELDTEATLDVLRIAFSEVEIPRTAKSSLDTSDSSTANLGDAKEYESATKDQNLWVQRTVDALVLIFDVYISQTSRSGGNDDAGTGVWPSKKDIGHFIEFIASYVALKRAIISKSVLGQILEYLASEINFSQDDPKQKKESVKRREKKVLALLNAAPETEWDATYVLDLCETAEFYQVCGLIHSIRSQYLAAMDSYMKDLDEPIHAFTFINSILPQLSGTELAAFRSAIFSRIPELTNLSRECTFFLIYDHFNKESGHILSELHSYPKSLFLYLKTLVEVHLSGTLNFPSLRIDDIANDPVDRRVKVGRSAIEAYWERLHDFPSVLRNNPVEVTDDMIELYLELLCQYEPESVLKFLETFENYRVEHCLKLCQEYGIVDAAAFLLERVGDVGSALLLTLSGINGKFIMLDTAVQDVVSDVKLSHMEHFNAALGLKEVQDISKILNACVGLCRRNTPRLDPKESESLWFYLLDSFCKPLMISEGKSDVRMLEKSLDSKLDEENSVITWRIPRDQPNSPTLKRLFSHFIKEVVEGMIGYVRLPSIMSKLLSDNGSQEFGDFKLTILGMLGTYGFERRLLDTAKSVVEDDTFYNMSLLKKGASKAYAPRSLVCCLCNCPFNKTSSSSGIRLFNCGHATHLQCEIGENASSHQNTYGGCPVCAPKKKIHKSKGKMVDQGLVNVSSSRPRHSRGNGIQHLHEVDAFETTHGLNQMSRFELLTNLQKNPRLVQIEPMPQLRLAPPAIYHEKVKKGTSLLLGEGSSDLTDAEKPSRNKQIRDLKVKGSSIRFPLTTRIFGKEKTRTQ